MTDARSGLERAHLLHDLIAGEAEECESLGRLTDSVANAMFDQGLFSLLLPRDAGGIGASLPEYFETVEQVATADASAAWCMAICNATNRMFHRAATEAGRQDVFGNGPVAMWTCLLPFAKSSPAQGGFHVSGRFGWGSGSSIAIWVLVTEPLPDRDGQQWFRSYAIPKSDVSILPDSWQVLGLKGTASMDYTIDEAFVPAHRSFEYPLIDAAGAYPISTVESASYHQIGMVAFASGVARRAVSELVSVASGVRRIKASSSQAEDETVQQGLGETQARLAAARGHYLALLAEQEAHFQQNGRTSREITEKCLYTANVVGRAARETTIFAFDNAGTGAIRLDNPIQRCLRDIFAGLKHPVFGSVHLRGLGKEMLGVEQSVLRF